jgi:hypothetical protein
VAYSDAQKAIAVEIVHRFDDTISGDAIAEIRNKLNAPKLPYQTIRNWFEAARLKNISTTKKEDFEGQVSIEQKAAQTLDSMFENTARMYLEHAQREHVVNRTSGNAAITSAAIAVDKMRLLRNLPTVIIEAAPILARLGEFFNEHQISASEVFEDLLNRFQDQTNVVHGEDIVNERRD